MDVVIQHMQRNHAVCLDPEMAQAAPKRDYYKKTSGCANTKGQTYEFKVAGLLYLRGLNSGLNFRLATNLRGAGAFDDIVFKIEGHNGKWTSYFIQLKHKDKAFCKLQLTNPTQKELYLPKYFDSHQLIKAAMSADEIETMFEGDFQDCVFVMYTNAKVEDLGESRCESEEINKLFRLETGHFVKFDSEGEPESDNAIADLWEKYSRENKLNKDAETQRKLETDWKDFVHRLCIFASQPSGAELDALLVDELRKAVGDENKIASINHLCAYFVESVKSWWEDQQYVLNQQSDLFTNALNRVLAENARLREQILAGMNSPSTSEAMSQPTAKRRNLDGCNATDFLKTLLETQKMAEDNLLLAYATRDWKMMDTLLEYIVDTKCLDNVKFVPFDECFILENDLHRLMEYCLEKHPDLYNDRTLHHRQRHDPCSANGLLAVACFHGSLRIVKMLLGRKFNVTGVSHSESHDVACNQSVPSPPLYCATARGHLEIVKLLVGQARNSFTRPEGVRNCSGFTNFLNRKACSDGKTALHVACLRGYTEVASFLINNGADLMIQDFGGRTCLHDAADSFEYQTDLIRKILACLHEADRLKFVGSVDRQGRTALHCVAKAGRLDAVQILVDVGGKASFIGHRRTALHQAVDDGTCAMAWYLSPSGKRDSVKEKRCTSEGKTPWLHPACLGSLAMAAPAVVVGSMLPVMGLLTAFDAAADTKMVKWIDARDKNGRSALDLAFAAGYQGVVQFLQKQGADARGAA